MNVDCWRLRLLAVADTCVCVCERVLTRRGGALRCAGAARWDQFVLAEAAVLVGLKVFVCRHALHQPANRPSGRLTKQTPPSSCNSARVRLRRPAGRAGGRAMNGLFRSEAVTYYNTYAVGYTFFSLLFHHHQELRTHTPPRPLQFPKQALVVAGGRWRVKQPFG